MNDLQQVSLEQLLPQRLYLVVFVDENQNSFCQTGDNEQTIKYITEQLLAKDIIIEDYFDEDDILNECGYSIYILS